MTKTDDQRIVLTLDAGGTNFVFSAMQANKEIATPVRLPANAHDLDKSLESMVAGFSQVIDQLDTRPAAISFAFPGPADYPRGIIVAPPNLKVYHGVALGPFLEDKFDMPVYINNDGDLFVYGEAIAGFLPKVNKMLEDAGSPKRFNKLFGITLGTGFGGGIVADGELYIGDNSTAGEIWITRSKRHPKCFAEEGVSIRAVKGTYARITGIDPADAPEPRDIYEIGTGKHDGNKDAALQAFAELGECVGDALANAISLLDCPIVIGGGLSAAYPLFIDSVLKEMNGTIDSLAGDKLPRMVQKSFDLEDPEDKKRFMQGDIKEVQVPGTQKTIKYDPMKRLGLGRAVLDTSQAISIGAYAFALSQLDQ
ncbi:Beta-glucoside kinase [Anaerohalosphaera lusitana]|uniref:Beta-glucoside kinase n=1 Tax=Anaerohalosphaera lusitana TaxID=1936003 RepID=A0A1U9NPM8_9BACT|nr:ROK family protein [Anaerohalosphaera lusitana]AQT69795.1 Beta-glucoside kinase [Anaerohalosphaera lusitana]